MTVYFRLSEAGYGTVNDIENWDARKVMQALYRIGFCEDYEAAYVEMNRKHEP